MDTRHMAELRWEGGVGDAKPALKSDRVSAQAERWMMGYGVGGTVFPDCEKSVGQPAGRVGGYEGVWGEENKKEREREREKKGIRICVSNTVS